LIKDFNPHEFTDKIARMCQSDGLKNFLLDDLKVKIYVTKNISDTEKSNPQKGNGTSSYNIKNKLINTTLTPQRYLCAYEGCNKVFLRKKNLNKHINIHAKVKAYICKNCKKEFNSNFNKNRHEINCKI